MKITIEQSKEDLQFVEVATRLGCLPETCVYIDWHPDHGQVEPYWQPMLYLKLLFEQLKQHSQID